MLKSNLLPGDGVHEPLGHGPDGVQQHVGRVHNNVHDRLGDQVLVLIEVM